MKFKVGLFGILTFIKTMCPFNGKLFKTPIPDTFTLPHTKQIHSFLQLLRDIDKTEAIILLFW